MLIIANGMVIDKREKRKPVMPTAITKIFFIMKKPKTMAIRL